MKKTITLIEDNKDLAGGLISNLELEGYEVSVCHDGAEAMKHIIEVRPDLLVLDMMLPHVDGFRIIELLQKQRINVPILCLTARSAEVDKVRALRSGADDYLTKPFGLMEFLARVEALLRRPQFDDLKAPIQLGHLHIDIEQKLATAHGQPVHLSPKEFHLLSHLASHPGRVFSRQELMQTVWGHQAAINSRTVDTHIAELRKKCQLSAGSAVSIKTVSKTGYQLLL